MSVTLTLSEAQAMKWLARFRRDLNPKRLVEVAGRRWHTLLLRHFRAEVATRHATAQRLGATPTKHWANPTSYVHYTKGGTEAEIAITRPGIARAVRDVTLRPRVARALALPIHRLSYGLRPAEAEQKLGLKLFRPKGTRLLVAARKDRRGNEKAWDILYVLSGAVFQKRDPTLLPPEDAVLTALTDAVQIESEAIALKAAREE